MARGEIRAKFGISKGTKDTAKGILTTVLKVAESATKGCPVWGPEAAISATLVILQGIDVSAIRASTLMDAF